MKRTYLVSAILLSHILPLIPFPRIIQIDSSNKAVYTISNFREGYGQVVRNGIGKQKSSPLNTESSTKLIKNNSITKEPTSIPTRGKESRTSSFIYTIKKLIVIIYLFGVCGFTLRLIFLCFSFLSFSKGRKLKTKDGKTIILTKKEISPCSFFNSIFITDSVLSNDDLEKIITHETVHCNQLHSIDILLLELFRIIHWYNPLVWFIGSTLRRNNEYIADRKVIDHGYNREEYQCLILKQLISQESISFANNFNFEPMKRRITMLNKKKSSKIAQLKILSIVPVLSIIVLLFASPDNITIVDYYENGVKALEAHYKDDILDGNYTQWYENGNKKFAAKFYRSSPISRFRGWYKNGQLEYEVKYHFGQPDEMFMRWFEDGSIQCSLTLYNGRVYGQSKYWYRNGKKLIEAAMDGNTIIGDLHAWYKSGKKMIAILSDGSQSYWHEDGSIGFQGKSRHITGHEFALFDTNNSRFTGTIILFFRDGKKAFEINFKNGIPEGKCAIWDSKGDYIFANNYQNGINVGMHSSWVEDGIISQEEFDRRNRPIRKILDERVEKLINDAAYVKNRNK